MVTTRNLRGVGRVWAPMHRAALAIVLVLAGCRCREADPTPAPSRVTPKRAAPIAAAQRPSLPPQQPFTAIAWSVAEASHTAASWDAAADAYEREMESCAEDCNETVYAIVLARRNAMLAAPITPPEGDKPVSLPPRVQALVDALDHYAAVGDPNDPDVAGVKFLAANALNKWRQPDAIARFEAVLRDHPTAEVAEYAANLLLHTLMQQERIQELEIWVARLLSDPAFLAGKPELEQTLAQLKTALSI